MAELCARLLQQGADIGFFVRELAGHLRNLFLLRQGGAAIAPSLRLPPDEAALWQELAPKFAPAHLHAAWQMTLDAQRGIVQSPEPAAALELLLLNLTLLPQLLPLERAMPCGPAGAGGAGQNSGKPGADRNTAGPQAPDQAMASQAGDHAMASQAGDQDGTAPPAAEAIAPTRGNTPRGIPQTGGHAAGPYGSTDRNGLRPTPSVEATPGFVPGPADAALRASLGFAPEDFVVLFCGRLEPDKGIHKLLEAMENIHDPRIKLLIVGSPFFGRTQQSPFLRKLEQQAETLGDRVRFTGYVPNDSMPEYYRLADLVCVPTLVEEAAGLVAVEAMGCGRPVLATRSGGMPEYLDGSQAVLVDRDGNVAGQLSFAIRMLYEHPDLRAQMSTAGAKTAQRYSSARFYDDFVRIVYDFGGHLWNSPSSV